MRGSRIEALTREHYLANEYDTLPESVRRRMTREEVATTHPNVVTRALGLDDSITIDALTVPAEPADVFVLTTDGFWKALPPLSVTKYVRTRANPGRWRGS